MEKDDKDWISTLGQLPVTVPDWSTDASTDAARAQRDAAIAERDAVIANLRFTEDQLKQAQTDRAAAEQELQALHEGRTTWETRDDDTVRVLVRRRVVEEVIGRVEVSLMAEIGVCFSYNVPEGERGSGSHTDPASDITTQMTAAQRVVELLSRVKP